MRVLRASQHLRRPWRNGGGLTSEVAVWPPGADAAADFDWRVSFAEVAGSGDFSLFPGVDRVIVLVDGPPMTLRSPTGVAVLERFRPYAFDGALPVSCEVTAATRDLNVMTRAGRVKADVVVLDLAEDAGPVALAPGRPLLVAVLSGEIRVEEVSGAVISSASIATTDVVESRDRVRVQGHGRIAVIRLLQTAPIGAGLGS